MSNNYLLLHKAKSTYIHVYVCYIRIPSTYKNA